MGRIIKTEKTEPIKKEGEKDFGNSELDNWDVELPEWNIEFPEWDVELPEKSDTLKKATNKETNVTLKK